MGDGFNLSNLSGTFIGVGKDVHVEVGGSVGAAGNPELERLLEELARVVDRHADQLEDPDVAADAVDEALASPEPRRLRTLLATVKGAASGVTAVTEAANAVLKLISGIG